MIEITFCFVVYYNQAQTCLSGVTSAYRVRCRVEVFHRTRKPHSPRDQETLHDGIVLK